MIVPIGVISFLVFLFTVIYASLNTDIKEGLAVPSPESLVPIPSTKIIPNGYYKYNATNMAPIPYGYYASTDKTQIFPNTVASQWTDIGSKQMDASMNMMNKGVSSESLVLIPRTGIIPDGYYKYDAYTMAPIPNGYYASSDKTQIFRTNANTSTVDFSNNKYSNDSRSIMNVQYHISDTDLMKQNDLSFGQTWVFDKSGNKVAFPSTKVQGNIVYYTPGSYPFGTSSYVPNYEDTIQLSKTTGMSTSTPFVSETKSSGFCNYSKTSPSMVENSCRSLNKDTCATTDCCVLFGGATCVAGDQYGPTQKTNYGDVFIRNKDYYYYRGKCYGNCSV